MSQVRHIGIGRVLRQQTSEITHGVRQRVSWLLVPVWDQEPSAVKDRSWKRHRRQQYRWP